eukprot:Skav223081  [mRNA]  locus=scaffold419:231967:232923:+ [translate_table: standard]
MRAVLSRIPLPRRTTAAGDTDSLRAGANDAADGLSRSEGSWQATVDACICAKGFAFDGGGTGCTACPIGSYKDLIGDSDCTKCEEAYTTFAAGSVSNSSCIEELLLKPTDDGDLPSTATVPAIRINVSMGQLPAVEDETKLREQLIVAWLQIIANMK